MTNPRFLVLVLDGLRPDLVTQTRMPALAAFRDRAASFAEARAQFPSITRVNKVSLATGAWPGEHGIWANAFWDPAIFPDRAVDLAKTADVHDADRAAGRLISVPTAGEYLARAGLRYAVVHTARPGAAWLLDYRGDRLGHSHYAFAGPQDCTPDDLPDAVAEALGPQPSASFPNIAQARHAVRLWREVLRPRLDPHVSVLWLNEPDSSFHRDGPHGPAATAALAGLDALVGDLLAWRDADAPDLNLVVASDHGHAGRAGYIDVAARAVAAGFDFADAPAPGATLLRADNPCGVHAPAEALDALAPFVAWLQAQPWCGHVFAGADDPVEGRFPGTFSLAAAGLTHPRVPPIVFLPRGDDAADPEGFTGRTLCVRAGEGPATGTSHGGLTEAEMRTVLIAEGDAFRAAVRLDSPASIRDVLPTLLDRFGLSSDPGAGGRILHEALSGGGATGIRRETLRAEVGGYAQRLEIAHVAGSRYLMSGATGPLAEG